MKSYPHYLYILLIFVLFGAPGYAQISDSLFKNLPDSLKPVDKDQLSFMEVDKILINAFKYSDWSPAMYAETDKLCYNFAGKYHEIENEKELYEFLHAVCNYLYYSMYYKRNRSKVDHNSLNILKNHYIIGIKYCDLFIKEFPTNVITSKYYLPNIYLYKTHFLVELDRQIDAYYSIVKSMEISRERNLLTSISISYSSMAYIVGVLDLSDQALAHYDSAFLAIKDMPETNSWVVGQRVYLQLCKQLAFLSKYRKTGQKQWADSVYRMYHLIKLADRQFNGAVEAESHVVLAGIEYNQKNFYKAISHIDSAFQIYPDLFRLGSAADGVAYKALSLLKMGDTQAGRSLLKTLDFSKLSDPVRVEVLEELYKFEKQQGDLRKAMAYHEHLLAYVKKKALLDLRGKALEMEQFYKVKQKEKQILLLEASHRQNLIVAGFLILIIICALVAIMFRYRASRLNAQRLISQLDELTQGQIVLIEEAEENERKRLAQNLHDDIAASIASCVIYLRMLADQLTDEKKTSRDLRSISDMMEASYESVRAKSHQLFLSSGNKQFINKLEEQVNLLTVAAQMKVHLNAVIENTQLLTEVKTAILLILKESITNIIKHSSASEVEILLYLDNGNLILEVTDNGKGFVDKKLALDEGFKTFGLKSIRERTQKLKGTFHIFSPNQKGVSIVINIPLQHATTDSMR
ncbi:signal transduction histidine kinase [Dyadobacter jejuensis]|uniref:histidine kinase n=1 Tax=Dyadobacter jejuensis TaxID=1082580 RepID=A0A316AH18_9BACT|nr:sensor histidine kinase [Dyadobacter jejuensis]PWJ57096.1 signal transduction histidine kinase [Dyadobacter jejuensis]